ncbi:DUF998 domain-containing protein [Blastococcus goldschmidtiae]|uniref:DUF998 domain-containing protein n=1 Tax=Blastococcus goldschmidtiae TaxID=3075546 RepID=A0ABU2K1S0_9ACTN|nr:DUF998 domain-containing protein [Blastococcus sp. DSM 46792]MDT0274283.1 DUF998 domain-containing protein [Blastococcus sp. DSM 46792]
MTVEAGPVAGTRTLEAECWDRPAVITRSLLGYGPLAGAVYLLAGAVQGHARDGFGFTRHSLSLLSNGPWGWIHVTTLVVTGLMTGAAALGVHRALRGGPGATAAGALLGGYGAALVLSGIFVADPMDGFPLGTPDGPPAEATLGGILHLVSGGVGFACLIAATVVLARRFAAESRHTWAGASVLTGAVVLAGFAGVASGSTSPVAVLGLWAGVVVGWAWLAAVSVHLYRRTPHPARPRD